MVISIQNLLESILCENAFIGFQAALKNFNGDIVKLMPAAVVLVRVTFTVDLIT